MPRQYKQIHFVFGQMSLFFHVQCPSISSYIYILSRNPFLSTIPKKCEISTLNNLKTFHWFLCSILRYVISQAKVKFLSSWVIRTWLNQRLNFDFLLWVIETYNRACKLLRILGLNDRLQAIRDLTRSLQLISIKFSWRSFPCHLKIHSGHRVFNYIYWQTKSSEGPILKFHNFSASFCIVIKLFTCFIVF